MDRVLDHRISRREFLAAGAAGGAAVLLGGAGSVVTAKPPAPLLDEQADWFEASIRDLGRLMRRRELSSVELTTAYLDRIALLNPTLHAVIETNPDALRIARRRDRERRNGHVRGPLHGIPILLKDNIATDDRMETTAGSLALVGSQVPEDATVAARLRSAGAVILGKANLSEWANFRGLSAPRRLFSTAGARAAASPATPMSSSATRAARARGRPSAPRPTCAPRRSAPRPTDRSSARPATTASSGSSRRSAWSRRRGSSRSPTARTRPGRWPAR